MHHYLQSALFVVTGTSTFVLASGDVEVVGHGQAESAVKIVAILGDIGSDAVCGPSLLARLEDVVGIEVYQQRLVEEGFIDSGTNSPIVFDALELIIGIARNSHIQHCTPRVPEDKRIPQIKAPQRPVMGQSRAILLGIKERLDKSQCCPGSIDSKSW